MKGLISSVEKIFIDERVEEKNDRCSFHGSLIHYWSPEIACPDCPVIARSFRISISPPFLLFAFSPFSLFLFSIYFL